MSRETDYLAARIERLERERDAALYAAGAWEAIAETRLTPAEHAERKRWIESGEERQRRRTA